MEISQTFDGNSTPVKKTTITRSELFVGEEVHIQEDTTHVYYLRSSVLGKVIAELDQTGYKRLGYVFAGGMQIATQHVWNPGSYDVALTTTSPATGSEYMVGGPYLGRKELDPFGTDVTEPPQQTLRRLSQRHQHRAGRRTVVALNRTERCHAASSAETCTGVSSNC